MARKNKDLIAAKRDLKILLIQFRPAGDVLLLTSVVKALKKKYPESAITFMVNEKESILIRDFPLIDNFILVKKIKKDNLPGYFRYIKYSLSIYLLTFRNRYDVVIDFIGNPKSAIVSFLSRALLRIGRRLGARSFAYNEIIPPYSENMNGITKRLSHLMPLGIDAQYIEPEINFSVEDRKFADAYIKLLDLGPEQKIIFLAPNSPRSARRWKADYFIAAGRALAEKLNAKILIAWGPGEEKYSAHITEGIGGSAEMIPPTSLKEMAAIISFSDIMITNDSGPKHMANAAGVSTVTIYGPTSPRTWNHPDWKTNPVIRADIPCIQCEKNICPMESHLCMEKITPDIVVSAVLRSITKK